MQTTEQGLPPGAESPGGSPSEGVGTLWVSVLKISVYFTY